MPVIYKSFQSVLANKEGKKLFYPRVVLTGNVDTEQVAKELAARKVTVNAVAPGFIDTEMTAVLPEQAKEAMLKTIPMARLGQPEDVARAVAFFASDEAAYITGQVLCVDGGMAV